MTFAQVFDAWKEEHYKKIGPNGIEGYDGAFKILRRCTTGSSGT